MQFQTICSLIPNAHDLLAMDEETLGMEVLKIAAANRQNGIMTIDAVTDFGLQSIFSPAAPSYPPAKLPEIKRALSEAWSWLIQERWIVQAEGRNGANGFYQLARKADQYLANPSPRPTIPRFPDDYLHPDIAEQVRKDLARGDMDRAIFSAFKVVEERVRAASRLNDELGVSLMRKAFSPGGMLADSELPAGENAARMDLFAGAIGTFKNPHSHRSVTVQYRDAMVAVTLASFLLRIVDERERAPN